jgi:ankyrin repeat protein
VDWIKRLLFRKKYLMEVLSPPDVISELHIAAYEGDVERVKKLLEKGANPNIQDEVGRTPLRNAAFKGHVDVVKLLLEHGADPNIQNEYGDTPLHMAVYWGRVDVVKLLLEYGADPTVRTRTGGLLST